MNNEIYDNDFEYDNEPLDDMYDYFDSPRGRFDSMIERMMSNGWITIMVGQEKYLVRALDHVTWIQNNPLSHNPIVSYYTAKTLHNSHMVKEIDSVFLSVVDCPVTRRDEYWEKRIAELEMLSS